MEMPIYLPVGTISVTESVENIPLILKDKFIKHWLGDKSVYIYFMDILKI